MKTPTPEKHRQDRVFIKPYSSQEIADFYGVGIKTFRRWITPFVNEVGDKNGRYYTVAQVKTIFSKLGIPGNYPDDPAM